MATPITWQNVAAQQPADVSRPLYLAQNAITSGLTAFGDALKNYEAGQRDVWKRQDADATQAVLDQIYRAGSVEEFNRMNAAGAFDQTRGPNDARIDRSAVNALRDTRPGVLQNRELQQLQYRDSLRQNEDAPVLAEGMASLANRDFSGAFSLMERLSPQGRALLASNIDKARQEDVTRNRDALKFEQGNQRFAWDGRRFDSEMIDAANRQAMAPLDRQARQLTIDGQVTTNALQALKLDDAKLTSAERAEALKLDGQIANLSQLYLTGISGMGKQQGQLATKLGLPIDGNGIPKFSTMNPEQLKRFDIAAKAAGVPESAAYMSGDTTQGNAVFDALASSGQYSPALLKKARESIIGSFDRTVLNKNVGVDALTAATRSAEAIVANESSERGNFFSPGAPKIMEQFPVMQKEIETIVSGSTTGLDAKEDVPYMQDALLEIVSNGIDIGNNKRVVPPVNVLMSIARTADGGWFRDEKRAENFKEKVKEWVLKPENLKAAREGLKSQTFRDEQRIKEIVASGGSASTRK